MTHLLFRVLPLKGTDMTRTRLGVGGATVSSFPKKLIKEVFLFLLALSR